MNRADEQVNFRLPADLRARLEAAASANQRTITAELRIRLEGSFGSDPPGWDEAPPWAVYRALDVDWAWYWFEKEPIPALSPVDGWDDRGGRVMYARQGPVQWRGSLETRPLPPPRPFAWYRPRQGDDADQEPEFRTSPPPDGHGWLPVPASAPQEWGR